MAEEKCATLTVGGGAVCTEGEYRCNGTQRQQCQGGQWVNVADPTNICGGGSQTWNLDVTSISFNPNPVQSGAVCVVSGEIKNTGTGPSPATGPFIALTVNGVEWGRTTTRIPSLSAGQTVTVDTGQNFKPTTTGDLNVCWILVW